LLNLPVFPVPRRALLNPIQNLTIAFAFGEFGLESFRGNPREPKPMSVYGTVEFLFTSNPGKRSPALVEGSGEDDVATEADPWASWRTLSKVGRGNDILWHRR
jgi:hypothetical protein